MEQRMYQGNINPDALADYLVNMFAESLGLTSAYHYQSLLLESGGGFLDTLPSKNFLSIHHKAFFPY